MANTVIQLKYSEGTATPASLNVAEPAYSNSSNKLFIGLSGNQVVAIGGKYYTDIVDAATDANTVSTIVKRDASGMFSATAVKASLFGNANTATILQTSRLIGVSGDIVTNTVSFNGSTDYLEVFGYLDTWNNSGATFKGKVFGAYKLIE